VRGILSGTVVHASSKPESGRRDCPDVRFVDSIAIPREHVAEILHFGSSGWKNLPVSGRTIRLSLRVLHRLRKRSMSSK